MRPTHRISAADVEDAARRLEAAERDRVAMVPVAELLPGLAADDAYAIQVHRRRLRLRAGARLVGHKIGLTSLAMQEMLGVDQPDYGYLLDEMIVPDGGHVDARTLLAPRVEAEIAFVLRSTLAGPHVTAEQVLDATEAVAPALEVIDSRIADWRITFVDTVADNASSARAALGARRPVDELDLARLTMRMDVDGTRVEGRGDAVLGHPATAVAWLARALHAQGEALEAGEIVLSGALARALPVTTGSRARAVVDGLGSVELSF